MDFYNNPKRVQSFRILLFIAFIILLVINISNYFVNDEINYWGICGNALMAISILVQLKRYSKEKKQ